MIGFNERIKELRAEKKLSIRALSAMTGISKSTIGVWEASEVVPKVDKLDVLAKFFDVSYPYLLGFSNERHETPKRYKPNINDVQNEPPSLTEIKTNFAHLNDANRDKLKSFSKFLLEQQLNNK